MSPRRRLALGLTLAAMLALLLAPAARADFGIDTFTTTFTNQDESPATLAGSHPYEFTTRIVMNQDPEGHREGTLQKLFVELPPGMVGDPMSLPRCSRKDFDSGFLPLCQGESQVGVANFELNQGGITGHVGIYNLTPSPGSAATLGLSIDNNNGLLNASVRTGGDYGATVTDPALPVAHELQQITTRIWGVPMEKSHDLQRLCAPEGATIPSENCSSSAPPAAFLSLPTRCKEALQTRLVVYATEGDEDEATVSTPGLKGCEAIPFDPEIEVQPDSAAAESPSGLAVSVKIPQSRDPKQRASAHLRDTVVTLPAGLAVNPSAADGLKSCSLAQVDLNGPGPAQCPDASKVGTVQVSSPLVDHPLPGSVYLARQGENPFGSLIALYLTVNDPLTGVVVKQAIKVVPDPVSGQLTAFTPNTPQLPFEVLDFNFFGGPRASLTTPPLCGTYTTQTAFTPWTAPEGKTVKPSDAFQITQGAGGGACPASEAQMPNSPGFEAGTTSPLAGTYSPFVMKLTRENGSQRFAALNLTLPPGLSAKLADVAECSEPQIAAAEARKNPGEGAAELASPSCPQASEVGIANVGAGSGTPIYVQGRAYLAGPYKSAPLSLVIITPAVAGPFDLGVVVVRTALFVDESTAQVSAKSDPIPLILQGIPLAVRSVAIRLDRDQFSLNPTNCEAKQFTGQVLSPAGHSADLVSPLQVAGCSGLDLEPRFSLRLKGSTHRRAHPALIATLLPREGDANIAFAQVKLPKAAFLDQAHIRTVCTRVQFAAGGGNGEQCPAGSIYGRAEAVTPLLGYPLKGTVYLRSSDHKLPDLVVAFKGPDRQPIKFALAGRTDSVKGALRNTFEAAPDVPVSSFRLELFGGKRGLVVMSNGFCAHPRASVRFEGHNGAEYRTRPAVRGRCGKGRRR